LDTAVTLTKLQPPRPRAGLVGRDRLERRLGEALASRPLTLLCAPAGFGKTAALTRQLAALPPGTALAWIAADADDDLHRFLRCLFAALEPFDLPWRTAPDALIAAAADVRHDHRGAAAALVNALAACEVPRGLIVIDDAHRITDAAVFEFLQSVLDRLPAHWGLVISTRVEPPLSLARLRARDELVELRQPDLSFTHEEVAALVASAGGGPDAAQLLERTGGWAAGLRLALNAHRPDRCPMLASRTMDRHMFEFLTTEVLDEMPPALREFLLRCSVLPELTAARCAAVSGDPRAAEWLAEIERRGLFVSVVEGPEPALTLHDLFRDCLQERLQRDRPELLTELLHRAADTEPDPIRRLSLLMRAGAWDEAELALEQVAETLFLEGATEPILRLIAQFPPERREHSPILALLRGQVAWDAWDWRAMAADMQRAVRGFAVTGDCRRLLRAQVFEAVALLGGGCSREGNARLAELDLAEADLETRALAKALDTWHAIDIGDFRRVADGYMAVLDLLEQTDRLRVWALCFQRTLYVWMPGMAAPLLRLHDGVMRRNGDTPTQMRAIAHVMAAWLALWRGDLDQAVERVAQAQEDARWLGMPNRLRMFVNAARAAVHAARNEREPALEATNALLDYFRSAPTSGPVERPTSMLGHYLLFASRLAHALGDLPALRDYAARVPPASEIRNHDALRRPLATLPARIAALEGRAADAACRWAELLRDDAALDLLGMAEEARLHHADALLRLSRKADAAATLRPALRAVTERGELGGVLLAGAAVITRLAAAPWRDELEPYELALLRGWAQRYGLAAGTRQPLVAADHPLSARELEVLARIAAGDSNKVIARTLELSPHTVKRHVANILDKLGLFSRSQAADWYRAHA